MGRVYTLLGENMTLGTGSVLAALQTASTVTSAGAFVAIRRVEVTQSHNTSTAQLRLALSKRSTAGTLTVTSATPSPLVIGGSASGISGGTAPTSVATCGINSSADSGGAYTDTWYCAPNNLNGYLWIPVPDERIILPPSTLFTVRFLTAPGDTAGWDVVVVFEELV